MESERLKRWTLTEHPNGLADVWLEGICASFSNREAAEQFMRLARRAAPEAGEGEARRYHELRLDDEGKLDDIVLQCDSVHLERMSDDFWWLGVYRGRERTTFHICRTGKLVKVTLMENDLQAPEVPAPEAPHGE